ncbi:Peptide-N(4)-(N-acetyl-beta- glucosaminyl)asparagine amidase [Apophysomyces sp. BC1034]|nr:Peptide-N(4)-(N-acetyl-beta- glucosaminyl)asparagine amidase [Apophysomyces sp. BC1034]
MSNIKRSGDVSMHCLHFQAFLEDDLRFFEFLLAMNDNHLMGDVKSDPNAQICWTMPKSKEYYKFKGKFYIASAPIQVTRFPPPKLPSSDLPPAEYWEAERKRQWRNLSDQVRATYTWPSCGDIPKSDSISFSCRSLQCMTEPNVSSGFFRTNSGRPSTDGALQVVHDIAMDNFCLLVYKVTAVEHFNYGVFPPKRTFYRALVLRYEDAALLERTLDLIPLHQLYEEAERNLEEKQDQSLGDEVVRRLLHWFKHEFFTWVDQAMCDYCGGKTISTNSTGPRAEEKSHDAFVVEMYKCLVCGNNTRFPRYNDPRKLLETKKGRCGEWANCFTLCCRAIGVEARLVLDETDHVWTEIYSEFEQRWIHCDSCENAFDQPLLYSEGWKKNLTYCIAFSAEEAIDVTKRYNRGYSEVLKRRNLVGENELSQYLAYLTFENQLRLSESRKIDLGIRRRNEENELEQACNRIHIKDEELIGRQSGKGYQQLALT